MNTSLKAILVVALALVVAAPLAAADKEEKRAAKKKNAGKNNVTAQLMKQIEKAEPTSEQKEKIAAIIKEHQPALAAAQAKIGMTKEQRQAGAEARKAAAAEGKKGKELQAAVAAAQNLSAEQQEAQKAQRELMAKVRAAVVDVLTPEQREQAGLNAGKGGGKKKKAA